jgi:uncharacterized protein YfbU (UPF0304 family)
MNFIEYKGYKITYDELNKYFEEMKEKREDRDKNLELICSIHEEIFNTYNKLKPPIDDTSLNFFKFKTIDEIKSDGSYITNKYINFTLNNSLFHLLNNIIEKKKEINIIKRIENLENIVIILFGFYIGSYIISF